MLACFASGLWLVRGDVPVEGVGRDPLPKPRAPGVGMLLPLSSRRERLELTLLPGEPTARRLSLHVNFQTGQISNRNQQTSLATGHEPCHQAAETALDTSHKKDQRQ